MGIFSWIILGLIVGALIKNFMPGKVEGGWATSLILGVVGAVVGGWIGTIVFNTGLGGFFNLRTWILAIVGGLVVAGIYGALRGRSGKSHTTAH
ncbi:GlsB/YeaQ/YmgE family stress response membrane protein [Paeniglutamicibacter cryotolerans]|uniref:Putative membrane protein YeaQ/YmgE (Transglycosylase-associated protein family) n=1 Tax=Paeniglutamicibacter cryotolerans TaxID=670079 RepID=A0A839QSM8_9MICC|nr:GlsB/YeaQ/YmgE family stress response membrane protein [Paeniglutamicibacter cryotolerans]MBB2996966.1 putative membrane protein YeaQ/YmgE (transglycosylase-associated protein family) [Paeniglutamicibacter cryotolerans]